MLSGALQAAGEQLQKAATREEREMAVLADLRLRRPDAGGPEARDVVRDALGAAEYDLDHAIAGLDLCGACGEVMDSEKISGLLGGERADALRRLLGAALQSRDTAVRTSACALAGDLARHAWPLLAPAANALVVPLGECLYVSHTDQAINAVWALGELIDRAPQAVASPKVLPVIAMRL